MSDLPPPNWRQRPPPPPPPPRGPAPSQRNRGLVTAAIVTALVLGLGAGALAITALEGDDSDPAPEPTDAPLATPPDTVEELPEGPPKPVDQANRYTRYVPSDPGFAYVARVPAGPGWGRPTESYPTSGALLRTTLRGPAGKFVLIDRTPSEVPQLGGGFDSSRTVDHPVFGEATEYIFRGSETIPECGDAICVDYLISDQTGGGWGVLAGGADLGETQAIAERVMRSVSLAE